MGDGLLRKAVIFDLDGVLVHTDCYHYLAWKQIAGEIGVPFDEKVNDRLRGVSRRESLDIILENCMEKPEEAEITRLLEKKNSIYRKLLEQLTPESVEASVRDTLEWLRREEIPAAVGSSSKNTEYILERTDLVRYFDAVADGNMITRSKPDPEVFLKAAELISVNPEDCIVVEDAVAGIQAAKSAGMYAVGIGEAAAYSGTDYGIRNLTELRRLILAWD